MPKSILSFFISLFSLATLTSCDNYNASHFGFSKLEQVQYEGTLNVLTRLSPTTYYNGPDGAAGLEYELITLFAKHLKVKVNFIVPNTFNEIIEQISAGKADLAAAGLTVTNERQKTMHFSPSYQSITEQVVYRSGKKKTWTYN